MSRTILAGLALVVTVGCAGPVDVVAPEVTTQPSFARGGKKAGPAAAATLAPITITVGESAVATSPYTVLSYWGCRGMSACEPIADILPISDNGDPTIIPGSSATITGRQPGTATLYVTNGLDEDGDGVMDAAETTLTVTP